MHKKLCAMLIASSAMLNGASTSLECMLVSAVQYEQPKALQEAITQCEQQGISFNSNDMLNKIAHKWLFASLKKKGLYTLTPIISFASLAACTYGTIFNSFSDSEWKELTNKDGESLDNILSKHPWSEQKQMLKTGALLSLGSIVPNAFIIWYAQKTYAQHEANYFAMANSILDSKMGSIDYSTMGNSVKQLICFAREHKKI